MIPPRVHTFSHYYRQKYGHPVGKIMVHTGYPCPNRQRGGCIFCGSASFTPGYLEQTDDIAAQIAKGKKSLIKGRFRQYFTCFQQETPTAIGTELLLPLCDFALQDTDCIGIIISTRPDYIGNELLDRLSEILVKTGKECLFELGVQSAHKRSLHLLNRNHSFSDFTDALQKIQQNEIFTTGAHVILGIPGESDLDMISTIQAVCRTGINALKLHHLQVIKNTPLHDMHMRKEISLFSLDEYIQLLLKIVVHIPPEVVIHRFWATSHPDVLIAPKWNILTGVLSVMLREKMEENGIWQGQNVASTSQPGEY